jgi:dTDP-4-dehydrorhamnose reductase
MTIVLGAKGQLGSELRHLLGDKALYFGHTELDLGDSSHLESAIRELKPAFVINAAAYNAVDRAETESDSALKINADAPGLLSKLSKELNFKFVHVSTDYVFDGESEIPYKETDVINPLNVYGRSKAEGEKLVLDANPNSVIFRTAWVHARNGKSFLNTVLRLAAEKKPMKVVSDSIGSPTWARDLAKVILKSRDLSGIFHYSNEGSCSWYDFACAIKQLAHLDIDLSPIPSSAYPTPAKRPKFSLLDKTKIKDALGIQVPHWRESLELCLKERI